MDASIKPSLMLSHIQQSRPRTKVLDLQTWFYPARLTFYRLGRFATALLTIEITLHLLLDFLSISGSLLPEVSGISSRPSPPCQLLLSSDWRVQKRSGPRLSSVQYNIHILQLVRVTRIQIITMAHPCLGKLEDAWPRQLTTQDRKSMLLKWQQVPFDSDQAAQKK